MSKSLEEIAQMGAEWWADKIARPRFDNGDNSASGGMAMMMAMLLVKPVEDDSKVKFTDILKAAIIEEFNNHPGRMFIDVDYGPCRMLHDAAQAADLPLNNFPWKTSMELDANHLTVRYGYCAEPKILYSNKDYWAKCIESAKHGIEEYENGSMLSWITDPAERAATKSERIAHIEQDIMRYEEGMAAAED